MKKIYFLAAAAMFSVVCVNAQITHTDFGPQGWHIPIDSDTELDLDGDNVTDFIVNSYGTGLSILPVFAIGCSSTDYFYDSNGNYIGNTLKIYNDGDVIGSGIYFDEGNPLPIWDNTHGNWGDWVPNEPSYTGIMMFGQHTFGWMRIEFDAINEEFVIYEYALEMTTQTDIVVGDRGISTGLADYNVQSELSVYPNPASNNVTIALPSRAGATQLEIIDMTGRIVHSEQLVAVENTVIEVANYKAGNYFVRWITATGIEQQRLTIQ